MNLKNFTNGILGEIEENTIFDKATILSEGGRRVKLESSMYEETVVFLKIINSNVIQIGYSNFINGNCITEYVQNNRVSLLAELMHF